MQNCKEIIQLSIRKTNNPTKKWAENLNSYFQVSHVDGQQVYEKMLKIINHQRNAI